MAKAKSKKITIEDALVPVDEQPYEVPGNWCWTKVKYVSEVVTGSTPSKKREEYYGGSFPFFKPADLDADDNVIDATEYLSDEGKAVSRIVPRLSTAVCCIGTIGKSGLLKIEGTTNQQINSMIPRINPLYVYYYSKTNEFVRELWDKSTSTTISMVNKSNMETNNIPLPPLQEQQRIVDQIESLFSKLDEVKEKVEGVIDQYKERRAAIIHKAYIGELSAKWREENGVSKDSWKITKIKEVCKSLKYGTAQKSEESGSVVVIRMGNLQEGEIEWNNLAYTNDQDDIKKYKLEAGDVLFNRTNSPEWVGKTSIYRGEYPAIYAGYLIKLDYYHEVLDGEFLNYMLNSVEAKEYCNKVKTDGVNQSNINAQKIGNFDIPIPTLKEQRIIVHVLREVLEKEKETKDISEGVAEMIEVIRKSILAKAFRGELGTNDPSEESSIELLKQILEEG